MARLSADDLQWELIKLGHEPTKMQRVDDGALLGAARLGDGALKLGEVGLKLGFTMLSGSLGLAGALALPHIVGAGLLLIGAAGTVVGARQLAGGMETRQRFLESRLEAWQRARERPVDRAYWRIEEVTAGPQGDQALLTALRTRAIDLDGPGMAVALTDHVAARRDAEAWESQRRPARPTRAGPG